MNAPILVAVAVFAWAINAPAVIVTTAFIIAFIALASDSRKLYRRWKHS